jgi:DNA polymerase-3 subunit gamma/tau
MFAKNKVNPTILITGEFGTGKTSLGRIIARYINCRKGELGDVCGLEEELCISCKAILAGSSPDLLEVNAGDSRGIDDVREIIEKSKLAPSMGGKKRIFILDEAQNFTSQAFQALLKPFEEPPPRSMWILTTTDPQKIPNPIKSRCLTLKLLPVVNSTIVTLLKKILRKEKITTIPDVVLEQIAGLSSGHVRNAVSMLESVSNYLETETTKDINVSEVLDSMGMTPPDVLVKKYLEFLFNCDYSAISILRKTESLNYFLALIVKFIKNIAFILTDTPEGDNVEVYKDFLLHTTFKKDPSVEDVILLLELFTDALERSKRYDLDILDLLDLVTLKALEVTKAL